MTFNEFTNAIYSEVLSQFRKLSYDVVSPEHHATFSVFKRVVKAPNGCSFSHIAYIDYFDDCVEFSHIGPDESVPNWYFSDVYPCDVVHFGVVIAFSDPLLFDKTLALVKRFLAYGA